MTRERWFHIVENHDDLAGHHEDVLDAVENPDLILRGYRGSLIAVRNYGCQRYLMMEETLTPEQTLSLAQAVPYMLGFPASRFWVDYDQDADVLYISFTRPQQATDTAMTDEGLLLRYRDGHIVGVTVLDASTRLPA